MSKPTFSFEVLPPLKGNSIDRVFNTIEQLKEFNPKFVNITTHHSEYVYKSTENGMFVKEAERRRPGTVAVAAAIQHKFGIPAVPHLICYGFTKPETEYALIDLDFLGINEVFVLRGDKGRGEMVVGLDESHQYAIDLQRQINRFNEGVFLDGSRREPSSTPFRYGVACYPEKHEEAPNFESDLFWLKKKQEEGAQYAVTQMFFDNEKYFSFVDRCRREGITIPIVAGLKPITLMNQLTVLPKIFSTEIPEALAKELRKCKNDQQAKEVGVEWCVEQSKGLIAGGVENLHYYTLMATESVRRTAEQIF